MEGTSLEELRKWEAVDKIIFTGSKVQNHHLANNKLGPSALGVNHSSEIYCTDGIFCLWHCCVCMCVRQAWFRLDTFLWLNLRPHVLNLTECYVCQTVNWGNIRSLNVLWKFYKMNKHRVRELSDMGRFWTFISGPCRAVIPTSEGSWLIVLRKREALREHRNVHCFGKVISG